MLEIEEAANRRYDILLTMGGIEKACSWKSGVT